MALLTEEDVRRMSDNGTRGPGVVNRGEVLTPGARDWLRAHKVSVVYPPGDSPARGAPMRGTISPSLTSRDTPFTAWMLP